MSGSNNNLIGRGAVAVESIVIALLSSPLFLGLAPSGRYYRVFELALVGVLLLMLIRAMAGMAEKPKVNAIKSSLRWSSKFLQLALIGSLAAISIHINTHVEVLTPIALFTGLAFALSLTFVILDELILGEYVETWTDIIYEETGDNVVGRKLRDSVDFAKEWMNTTVNNESPHTFKKTLKALLFAVGSLSLLLIVSLPAWLILATFFGSWGVAMLVVMSIFFVRDMTRYIYLNYGAATSLAELKWSLKFEFVWIVVIGVLLAGALDYDLPFTV